MFTKNELYYLLDFDFPQTYAICFGPSTRNRASFSLADLPPIWSIIRRTFLRSVILANNRICR